MPSVAEVLAAEYPTLYTNVRCGVTIGWGWLGIIREMSEKLLALGNQIEIRQVKEKFGTMRVYVGDCSDLERKIVHDAEVMSFITCEDCGNTGQLTSIGHGWMRTLCGRCEMSCRSTEATRRGGEVMDVWVVRRGNEYVESVGVDKYTYQMEFILTEDRDAAIEYTDRVAAYGVAYDLAEDGDDVRVLKRRV